MTDTIRAGEFDGDPAEWDDFAKAASGSYFSHQFGWLQLVQDVYGGEPHYLCAENEQGICGVLPLVIRSVFKEGRVAFSTPLADVGGIIANTQDAEEALLQKAYKLVEDYETTYVEFRQREQSLPNTEADLERVNLELELPADADVLWDDFQGKVRNQVRKARKSGLEAHVENDIHAAISEAFYPVYSENMRDLGSPMHSERFFHEVADRFVDAVDIVVVRKDNTVVGAGFAVKWRDTFAVPWASSLRRYFSLCPNNILYWELMVHAIEEGYSVFDFGRSPKDSGTYRFKKQWGADPIQLHYCYFPPPNAPVDEEKRDSLAYRMFSSIWQKTPLPVAQLVGPKIFARLPL